MKSKIENQILKRMENDRQSLRHSADRLLEAVCHEKLSSQVLVSDNMKAVDQVLKNLTTLKSVTSEFETIDDYIFYQTYSAGIMKRIVELDSNWYNNALGYMLGIRTADGALVAFLPDFRGHYTYYDPTRRRKVRIHAGNAAQFSSEAILFYPAFPQESMTPVTLLTSFVRTFGWNGLLITSAFTFLYVIFSTLIPAALYRLFGDVLSAKSPDMILSLAIFLTGAIINLYLFRFLRKVALDRIVLATGCLIEAATFSRVLLLPTSFHQKYNAADLSNLIRYVSTFSESFTKLLLDSCISLLSSLIFLAEIAYFAPGLLTPVLVILGIACLMSYLFVRLEIRHARDKYEAELAEKSISYSLIHGIEKIRATGSEARMFSQWSDAYARKNSALYDPPPLLKMGPALLTLLSSGSFLYLYGETLKTGTSLAGFLAFIAAFLFLITSVISGVDSLMDFAESLPMLKKAMPIFETAPETLGDHKLVTALSGDIQLQDVVYHFEDSSFYLFNHLNLHILSGESVGIIGADSSSKAALINLLLGYITPDSGMVLYDSDNLETLDLRSLRHHIGTMREEDKLIPGTIRGNIALSDPFLSEDEIWEALRIVGLEDYVAALPLGLNTVILEGNDSSTGGMRRKLILARAIATKPSVLIMDESAKAIDNLAKKELIDALLQLKSTRIIFAHDLSTVINCDRVLVIKDGCITEKKKAAL